MFVRSWKVLAVVVGLVFSPLSAWAEGEASNSLYFSVESGAFSGPLPYGKSFGVFTNASAGSTVTLHVLRLGDKSSCPATLKDLKALQPMSYVGAPTGAPTDAGVQRFEFRLPKLYPYESYCVGAEQLEIREWDIDEVSELVDALVTAAWTLGKRAVGGDNTPAYPLECKHLGATPPTNPEGAIIHNCDLAAATIENLPDRLQQSLIYDKKAGKGISLLKALYKELEGKDSKLFVQAIQREVVDVIATVRERESLEPSIKESIRSILDRGDPNALLYDPIAGLTKKEICDSLDTATTSGKAAQVACNASSDEEFRNKLYELRASWLSADAQKTKLAANKQALLESFLRAKEKPPYLETKLSEVSRDFPSTPDKPALDVVEKLQAVIAPLVARADTLPDPRETVNAKVLGFGDPSDKPRTNDFAQLNAVLGNLKLVREAQKKGAEIDKTLKADDAFKAFVKRLRSQEFFVGAIHTTKPTEGTMEELFPFYASMDVGAAFFFFGQDETGLAQHLGVNFYFQAIDPSEPLRRPNDSLGRDFLRRFSLTVGLTTNGKKVDAGGRASGVIGEQYVLLGAGLRLAPFLRVSGGSFLFRAGGENPLQDQLRTRAGGYAALSVDIAAFTIIANGYKSMTGAGGS